MRCAIPKATISLLSLLALTHTAVAQEADVALESRVTGNQEQPNVLTIVPWKTADDFQVIEQGYDEQFDRLFPHLEPTEFDRRRHFADELNNPSTSN